MPPNAAALCARSANFTASSGSQPWTCSSGARAPCRSTRLTPHKHGPSRCNPGATTWADSRPPGFRVLASPSSSPPSPSKPAPECCPRPTPSANEPCISQHSRLPMLQDGFCNHSIPIGHRRRLTPNGRIANALARPLCSTGNASAPGRSRYSAKDLATGIGLL